ncbi:MAG: hypothetical protein CM1200mP38_3390 [Dehalococcoidia bacterium]|nr:MAG: hypothetical protein CM1200mP38_3390 [Dehalococcoidia bacterium]
MIRTDRGIWISAILQTSNPFECSRCLDEFNQQINLQLEEEYLEENSSSLQQTQIKKSEMTKISKLTQTSARPFGCNYAILSNQKPP